MNIQHIANKVLKSNGTYKSINDIKTGDRIMNMHGKPVRVRNIEKRKANHRTILINIKHDNWFSNIVLGEEANILIWNNEQKKPNWIQAGNFSSEYEHVTLLPTQMNWDIPEIMKINYKNMCLTPSYELGFLVGAYLRLGYQREAYDKSFKTINFHCDTSSKNTVDAIRAYMKLIFGVEAINKSQTYFFDLHFDDSDVIKFFGRLHTGGSRKKLPHKMMCNDLNYVQGLNSGIMFSGTDGHPKITDNDTREILYWTSLLLGKPLNYGQLKRSYLGKEYLTARSVLHAVEKSMTDLSFIDVECDTGSYILNNLIVRND